MNTTKSQANKPEVVAKPNTGAKLVQFMENFSFYIVIALTTYFLFIQKQMYYFVQEVNNSEEPFNYLELLLIPFGCVFTVFLQKLIEYLATDYIKRNVFEKKVRKETNEQQIARLNRYIHGLVFYTICTIIHYNLIKGTDLMPKLFGGSLDVSNFKDYWPKDIPDSVRWFFLFRFGYHIMDMLHQIIHKRHSSDFFVMNLHHFVTFFLMIVAYWCRQLQFGVPVLFIHDFGDPPLNAVRLFRELKNLKKFMMPTFLFMYLTWFFTRIIVYSAEILNFLVGVIHGIPEQKKYYFDACLFQIICLYCLGILDYYWVLMTTKIMYDKLVKNQENVIHEGETGNKDKQKSD